LRALAGPRGAVTVIAAHRPCLLPLDDVGCVTDIDTVADLEAAGALLAVRGSTP
jgi:hypothetical protein